MSKPTYYLWKSEFLTEKEYEVAKELYRKLGFRVVTYREGPKDKEIHDGLKAVIRNHMG